MLESYKLPLHSATFLNECHNYTMICTSVLLESNLQGPSLKALDVPVCGRNLSSKGTKSCHDMGTHLLTRVKHCCLQMGQKKCKSSSSANKLFASQHRLRASFGVICKAFAVLPESPGSKAGRTSGMVVDIKSTAQYHRSAVATSGAARPCQFKHLREEAYTVFVAVEVASVQKTVEAADSDST